MTASFKVDALEISLDTAGIVEANDNGVNIITRDGLVLRLDGLLVDRIVKEHNEQRAADIMAAAS